MSLQTVQDPVMGNSAGEEKFVLGEWAEQPNLYLVMR